MWSAYYLDQQKERHDLGNYDRYDDAVTAALKTIHGPEVARFAFVEKNGKEYSKYYGAIL